MAKYHHGWSSCSQIEAEETTTGRGRGQGLPAVAKCFIVKKYLQNKFDPNWSEEEKAAYYKRKERTTFKVGRDLSMEADLVCYVSTRDDVFKVIFPPYRELLFLVRHRPQTAGLTEADS